MTADRDGVDEHERTRRRSTPHRTAAEAMGVTPAIGRQGGGPGEERLGGGDKDLRRQLEAAEEALEKARTEAREANDRYLRTVAEMENMRRRHRQEQADRIQFAN